MIYEFSMWYTNNHDDVMTKCYVHLKLSLMMYRILFSLITVND